MKRLLVLAAVLLALGTSGATAHRSAFAGKQLQPRQIAALCYQFGWRDLELVKCVGTALGESHGYLGAYHDNYSSSGTLLSRDVGLFQINIPASLVGTQTEADLYDPVNNVSAARALYERRHWQPWVAYTSGWVTFPEWWVWTQAEPHHWAATGRYIHQAIRGVANFYAQQFGVTIPFADYYSIPPKPTEPPADGVGPRPVPNNGL